MASPCCGAWPPAGQNMNGAEHHVHLPGSGCRRESQVVEYPGMYSSTLAAQARPSSQSTSGTRRASAAYGGEWDSCALPAGKHQEDQPSTKARCTPGAWFCKQTKPGGVEVKTRQRNEQPLDHLRGWGHHRPKAHLGVEFLLQFLCSLSSSVAAVNGRTSQAKKSEAVATAAPDGRLFQQPPASL